jgi:hypothetical protein
VKLVDYRKPLGGSVRELVVTSNHTSVSTSAPPKNGEGFTQSWGRERERGWGHG